MENTGKEDLPPTLELDENQRREAAVFRFELGLKMAEYLSEAFRQAHQAKNISPEAFWRALFLKTGNTGKGPVSIKSPGKIDGYPDKVPEDPYKKLDFQACNKYLLYGGNRRVNNDGSFVTDSLACLEYYGIPYKDRRPIGLYLDVLRRCIQIRNQFSHADTQSLEAITRQELDQSIQDMKDLTQPMREKHRGWEERAGLADTLVSFWRKQEARYQREFGGAPISLEELGHELFFSEEEALTLEQQEALGQAVEYFNLKVVGGKVYQAAGRRVLAEKLRSAPSVAALLHTPAAASPEEAQRKAEEAQRPDVDELPVLPPLEQPLWLPLDRSAAEALQRAGTGLVTLSGGVINALLDSFTLMVDESILLCAEGRALLTEQLAPLLRKRREKLRIDESVVSRLFRDFRGSVPYTSLELAEMDIPPELAGELQEERHKIHTLNKMAIKAMGFLRRQGCLEVAASPTNSEYSFENIYRVVEHYPKERFLVLTTDRELARELKDVYGRNAVAAKPTLNGQLLLFRTTAPTYQSILQATAPAPSPPTKNLLKLRSRPGPGEQVAAEWPDGSQEMLRLGRLAGEGGEGQVFHTSASDGGMAKLYFAQQLTQERKDKLSYMLQRDPHIPGVCWPKAMLYNERGEWLGFLMPQGEGTKLHLTVFHPGRGGSVLTALGWTRRSLALIAANIAGIFREMHRKNILMCDVNAQNFLIQPDCSVFLVDCDSYQVGPYRCSVGVQLYTPPEIHREMRRTGQENYSFVRTEEHERYSLAVLLFQILMLGKPPFESRNTNQEDVVQAILSGTFPYPYRSDNEEGEGAVRAGLLAPVGRWRNIWSHLPYQVKTGFYNVFTGKERLSAAQWEQVLREYIRLIDAGYQSDELMPDSYKVVEDSANRMVDLVCSQCRCHFNMGEDVYRRRMQRGEPILCGTHWSVRQNIRRRTNDQVRATCSSCKQSVAITIADWTDRTAGGSRAFLCGSCLEREAPLVVCDTPGCNNSFRINRSRLEKNLRLRQPVLCRKCQEKRKTEGQI